VEILNIKTEDVDIDHVLPHPRNPNKGDLAAIDESINATGFYGRIVVNQRTGFIVSGNHRYKVLKAKDVDAETELSILARDNRLTRLGEDDPEILLSILRELEETDAGLVGTGYTHDNINELDALLKDLEEDSNLTIANLAHETLQERFIVPPFSILDARQGYWNERKKAWLALGLRSEAGRGNDGDKSQKGLTYAASSQPPEVYVKKNAYEAQVGRSVTWDEFIAAHPEQVRLHGTSVFDPVLCELAYRWFVPPGGSVLDPFAGGSVRGIVASRLGHPYTGVDLRPEQVAANEEQAKELCPQGDIDHPLPVWHVGDSCNIATIAPGEYDFVFSCPPYADLEKYSNDPADLSTMKYSEFLEAYRVIIAASVAMLKDDRFACFVIGDIRDKNGFYRNFVSHTIDAFQDAGMHLYNEAILITHAASLAIRAGSVFTKSRKLGKTHQNVLVFYKGNPKNIRDIYGPVECGTEVPTSYDEVSETVGREDEEVVLDDDLVLA
jgi:DNA modification methylase